MIDKYFLGIDSGGTMIKVALFSQNGEEVAAVSKAVEIICTELLWSERDAWQMWQDMASLIKQVIENSKVEPAQIAAIACTGHGNGLYLTDENGIPVRNAINSMDLRATKYIEQWVKHDVDKKVLPKTTQRLWAAQPGALLAWLRDNEPNVIKKAHYLFMSKDFIRYQLTGNALSEITDMSGTSLMNVVTRHYDNSILEEFGIAEYERLLTPLVESADIAGFVTCQAAELTGLKEGTIVAGGMFDIDACALSSGIINSKQMSLIAGTWGNNQYIAKSPLVDKDLFMTSVYSVPGWYLMLEGSPTSAGNLEWFIKTFLEHEKQTMGDRFFDWLSDEVISAKNGSSELLFIPFLYGCNSVKELPAMFYGLKSSHTKADMIRAVFEGIAFAHKTHYIRLLNFRQKPEVIRCSGGASSSDVWMQMFADVLDLPVEVPNGSQLGALGAAMAAAVASQCYTDFEHAVKSMTSIKKRFTPLSGMKDMYEMKYQRYLDLIEKLSA